MRVAHIKQEGIALCGENCEPGYSSTVASIFSVAGGCLERGEKVRLNKDLCKVCLRKMVCISKLALTGAKY